MDMWEDDLMVKDAYLYFLNYNKDKQKLKDRIRSRYGNIFSQEDVDKYLKENLKRKDYVEQATNAKVTWKPITRGTITLL